MQNACGALLNSIKLAMSLKTNFGERRHLHAGRGEKETAEETCLAQFYL